MGKYFAYLIIILVALFALEWLGVIDIPYLDLPDFTAGKANMINQSADIVESVK